MRLTTFSDYSIRVLIYIGLHPQQKVTINEIAQAYGISRNHLMKVVHHLGKQGCIETLRGKGGGLLLARSADQINIGELIRGTEERVALLSCLTQQDEECRIREACELRGMLDQAVEAFFKVLDDYTLADLLKQQDQLQRLLHP